MVVVGLRRGDAEVAEAGRVVDQQRARNEASEERGEAADFAGVPLSLHNANSPLGVLVVAVMSAQNEVAGGMIGGVEHVITQAGILHVTIGAKRQMLLRLQLRFVTTRAFFRRYAQCAEHQFR